MLEDCPDQSTGKEEIRAQERTRLEHRKETQERTRAEHRKGPEQSTGKDQSRAQEYMVISLAETVMRSSLRKVFSVIISVGTLLLVKVGHGFLCDSMKSRLSSAIWRPGSIMATASLCQECSAMQLKTFARKHHIGCLPVAQHSFPQ